ncbi:MAG TPA: methyltransferase [Bryobacteraceae bacterium]
MSTQAQQPNPILVFEALNRYQQSMALKSAIDLEIFTHIADGAKTPAAIASRSQAAERGVRILCDYLTILGFLSKTNGGYDLTLDSAAFLNKRSPAYLGTVANFLINPESVARFQELTAAVRKGGTPDGTGTMKPDNEFWVEFARSMMPLVRIIAQLLVPIVSQPGRKMKVLDIAAGHGIFGISVAQQNPQAEIVGVDWKSVLAVALENAKAAGVEKRYSTIAGSAFEQDLGSGYDLVLIPNFLHHFDPPTNVAFLKRVHAALNPGGRVATVEFIPNDDRVSPAPAAAFSLVMLANTASGDAYTFRELEAMFREAGFGESRLQDLPPSPSRLVLTMRD